MARYAEPTPEQEACWKAWLAERPPAVRAVAERFEPWSLYRMKSTGQRVTLSSFNEGKKDAVTLTVNVTGEFNAVMFDRQVFGIDPDNLEPCEIPDQAEPTGTLMSNSEVDENIDALRVLVRPDLFALDGAGKAQRKS